MSPVGSSVATTTVARWLGSQWLYLGVWLDHNLIGSMSFGRAIDIRKSRRLVHGTAWDGFVELGRLCMVDDTPPNVESRALSVALRLIRREYPYIEWVQTFADATQSGDGTIYRALGFLLTQIKVNRQLMRGTATDSGKAIAAVTASKGVYALRQGGKSSIQWLKDAGYEYIPGYQLRYVKFLYPDMEHRLMCPILPYTEIDRVGAGMYKGRPKDSSEPLGSPAERGRGSTDPDAPAHVRFVHLMSCG